MPVVGKDERYDYLFAYYPSGIIRGGYRAINQENIPKDSIRFLGYIDDSFFEMITGEKK